MIKKADGFPVKAFTHKIAELNCFIRPARPNSEITNQINSKLILGETRTGHTLALVATTLHIMIISNLQNTQTITDDISRVCHMVFGWAISDAIVLKCFVLSQRLHTVTVRWCLPGNSHAVILHCL